MYVLVYGCVLAGGISKKTKPGTSLYAIQRHVRVENGGGCTPGERGELSAFISQHASNRGGYETAWRSWNDYLGLLRKPERPDPFLGQIPQEGKSIRLARFVQHLWDSGVRGDALNNRMTSLKMIFLEALVDVTCFSAPIVSRAKRAGRLNPEEKLEKEKRRVANQSLPTTMDMLWPIRDEFWSNESWLCEGMDRRAVWLAIAMSYDGGPRVSNVTMKDGGKTDHCIRAKEVTFVYTAQDGSTQKVSAGEPFRRDTADLSLPTCVSRCEYRFLTGKVNMPYAYHTIARRTSVESTLLDDLILYVLRSRVKGTDELFTRYPGPGESKALGNGNYSRKSLTRKEYRAGLTWAAEKAGLPPASLKPSGTRMGCAETLRATGASDKELRHGRWSENSKVPQRHYLSREVDLLFSKDGAGEEPSRGSFARVSSKQGIPEFNLRHVKSIAQSRGVVDNVPGEGLSLLGGK